MRSPIIAPISNVTTVFLLHLRLWSCFDDIVAGLVLLQRGMEGTGQFPNYQTFIYSS